eukprot:278827-Pyramimonas_sp.AAC.1
MWESFLMFGATLMAARQKSLGSPCGMYIHVFGALSGPLPGPCGTLMEPPRRAPEAMLRRWLHS